MKDPNTMTAAELARVVERSPELASSIIKAKPEEVARWKDSTPRDPEKAFDWERFSNGDLPFFEKARADGSYQLALDARNARIAAEAKAAALVERDKAIEAHLAGLDAADVERRRREDERETKRLEGIQLPNRKPAA